MYKKARRLHKLILVVLILLVSPAIAQHDMHSMEMPVSNDKPIELITNIGKLHHPVSTKNKEAQAYFDQGLALIYALNTGDAVRSFKRASELDTNLAMAYWGMAAASVGFSSAFEISNEDRKSAYDNLQKALPLQASPEDHAFIEALLKKVPADSFTDPLALNAAYRDAMKNVFAQYPNDVDAGIFYAWSVIELKARPEWPWLERWDVHGNFTPEGAAGAKILGELVKQFPDHFGANHFYIHIIEGSTHPEMALESAKRIVAMKFDDLRMGHLVHMPAHIYLRIGNYEEAAKADEAAINMNDTTVSHDQQMFVHAHSADFLLYTYTMQGRYRDFSHIMMVFIANPQLTEEEFPHKIYAPEQLVRFRKWDQIINAQEPGKNNFKALWAKAMAYAATGQFAGADTELQKFTMRIDTVIAQTDESKNPMWLSEYKDLKVLFADGVKAMIARTKKDYAQAIQILREAVVTEDNIFYSEPPLLWLPLRESLGAVLILNKNYAEAEKVFREELEKRPNNPRALFGLSKALEAEGKKDEAAIVEKEFKEQWKYADTQLSIEDL